MRSAFFPFMGGFPSPKEGRFGLLRSPDLSRKVGCPPAGFAGRLADLPTKVT